MTHERRLTDVARQELCGCSLRKTVFQAFVRMLPAGTCMRIRMRFYRLMGVKIGRGTTVTGTMQLSAGGQGLRNLCIGANCYFNEGLYFDVRERVTIGDNVSVGMQCLFITATHEIGDAVFRAGKLSFLPVTVGDGCWLGARVTVLPGVTIGAGTVVGAGAVVVRDLPANVLAAGIPAKVIRELE